MYQHHWSQSEFVFGEVATVEFQAGKRAEPQADLIEVSLIDIHSNDPLCGCTVDLLQAVAARYPQHCYTLRTTAMESNLEEFRQGCQLPHTCGAHVPFIIFEGYREPRIWHGLNFRRIPPEVDRELRRKAAQRKQSLNQIIIDELTAATIGVRKRADFHDVVGRWTPDPEFDEILASQRQIDPETSSGCPN